MQLVIPHNAEPFELSVNYDKQISISLPDNPLVTEDLFIQSNFTMRSMRMNLPSKLLQVVFNTPAICVHCYNEDNQLSLYSSRRLNKLT